MVPIEELVFITGGGLNGLIVERSGHPERPRTLINPFPDLAMAGIVTTAPTLHAAFGRHGPHDE